MIMTGRDAVRRTEALRGSRACFHRFDCAIARRRVGHERIEQMVCGVSDIIDGTIESCLVYLGRFRETAQLADELKRRSANLVVRRRWTEVMKCFDGSAHAGTIHTSRSTINYFMFRAVSEGDQPSTPGSNRGLFRDADIFGLGEEVQRFFAAFAADAALFHSAKGNPQVAHQPAIHPNRSGVDLLCDTMGAS